jgi:ABC-type proline/glycine betaine transport system permease subunit
MKKEYVIVITMYVLIALIGAPIIGIFVRFGSWDLYKSSVIIGAVWSTASMIIYLLLFELLPRVLDLFSGRSNG